MMERISPLHRAIHRAIQRAIHRAVHRAVHRAIAVTKPRTRAPLARAVKTFYGFVIQEKTASIMCAKPRNREAPHTLGASAAINPKRVE